MLNKLLSYEFTTSVRVLYFFKAFQECYGDNVWLDADQKAIVTNLDIKGL